MTTTALDLKEEVHFSLDFETLAAKSSRPAILSIGIIEFDPNKVQTPAEISGNPHLYLALSLDGQTDKYDRVIEGDTLAWWMKQDADVREKLFNGGSTLGFKQAFLDLDRWVANRLESYAVPTSESSHSLELPALHMWSYGVKSDLMWWTTACEAIDVPYPVHYRNERCLRMLANTLPEVPRVAYGSKHDALDDAIGQAAWAQLLNARMRELRALSVSNNVNKIQ